MCICELKLSSIARKSLEIVNPTLIEGRGSVRCSFAVTVVESVNHVAQTSLYAQYCYVQ
jgi:hypothetical protein